MRIGLLSLMAISGCATNSPAYHRHIMQGQVLSVEDNTLTLCVGKRDGEKEGQLVDLVRYVQQPSLPKATSPSFRREPVGSARIASVLDERYATAEVLDGQPKVNDVAELKDR